LISHRLQLEGITSQNFIFANVTSTDENFNSTTIYLFNGSLEVINLSLIGINSVPDDLSELSEIAISSVEITPATYNFSELSDGVYYLNATTNDSVGNINETTTRTITLDTTDPSVSVISPGNNSISSDTSLDITYLAEDTYLGSCWYSNDSMLTNTTLPSCANITNVVWSNGVHNVIIYINDSAGNKNSTGVTFTIDTGAPEMSFISVSNNSKSNNVSLDITYLATDSYLDSCWYSNDSYLTNTTLTSCANITGITWTEGQHNVTVWANDSTGNTGGSTLNFSIDITNPLIAIDQPSNASSTTNFGLEILYNISDINLDSCWYSNDTYLTNTTLDDCGNITDVTWSNGQHNLTVWTNDSVGNQNSSEVTFTIIVLDLDEPTVVISSPANGSATINTTIHALYTASDEYLESCWYSNDSYLTNTTLASCTTNITTLTWTEGQHNLTIWANDTSENIGYAQSTFTIDRDSPTITITSPINNSYSSNTELPINYSAVDLTLESCWYKIETDINNNTLTGCANITRVTWSQGQHNITLWVNDSAGNSNSTDVTFIIDSIDPSVSITSPTNNTLSNNTTLNVNYLATDTYLESCWYSNDSMLSNTTLASCTTNITTITWTESQHNITIWANDSAQNVGSDSVTFIVDHTNPEINILSPTDNYNSTDNSLDVKYLATDSYLSSCWYSNDSYLVNTTLTGCANITAVTWSIGQHNVTVWVNDTYGNKNNTSVSFTIQQDTDGDTLPDTTDTLLYNETNVTKSGLTRLNVTVGGNLTNGTFSGEQEMLFYDQTDLMVNFSHNFSQATFDMSNISITKTSTSLIVNFSGQLQENKTLFIADNSFISLCVKDMEVSSISEVSSGCNGANETDFTNCLGGNLFSNGINCTDGGSTIRIDNLQYSAVKGTQATPTSTPTPTDSGAATGGAGGGGGGSVISVNDTEEEIIDYECTYNYECADDETCHNHQCLKVFDIKIINIDYPILDYDLGFTYFLKGMANINDDVIVEFWLEKDGEKISSGQDTIYLSEFEEKTESTKIFLPPTIQTGEYHFYVKVNYGKYHAESYRTVYVEHGEGGIKAKLVDGEILQDVKGFAINLSLVLICLIILSVIIILIKRSLKKSKPRVRLISKHKKETKSQIVIERRFTKRTFRKIIRNIFRFFFNCVKAPFIGVAIIIKEFFREAKRFFKFCFKYAKVPFIGLAIFFTWIAHGLMLFFRWVGHGFAKLYGFFSIKRRLRNYRSRKQRRKEKELEFMKKELKERIKLKKQEYKLTLKEKEKSTISPEHTKPISKAISSKPQEVKKGHRRTRTQILDDGLSEVDKKLSALGDVQPPEMTRPPPKEALLGKRETILNRINELSKKQVLAQQRVKIRSQLPEVKKKHHRRTRKQILADELLNVEKGIGNIKVAERAEITSYLEKQPIRRRRVIEETRPVIRDDVPKFKRTVIIKENLKEKVEQKLSPPTEIKKKRSRRTKKQVLSDELSTINDELNKL